jgi:hypothetical protein
VAGDFVSILLQNCSTLLIRITGHDCYARNGHLLHGTIHRVLTIVAGILALRQLVSRAGLGMSAEVLAIQQLFEGGIEVLRRVMLERTTGCQELTVNEAFPFGVWERKVAAPLIFDARAAAHSLIFRPTAVLVSNASPA